MSDNSDGRIVTIKGRGISLRGNDIDTDRIIPARFLREITFSRMGEYPFYDERFAPDGTPTSHPFNDSRRQGASFLVVNGNFGCGSSREHAPQALKRWGIRAVAAESLAEIFAGNCVMIGLPAVVLEAAELKKLQDLVEARPDLELTLDLAGKTLGWGEEPLKVTLPESQRRAFVEGLWDTTALLLDNLSLARDIAAKLPYTAGFRT